MELPRCPRQRAGRGGPSALISSTGMEKTDPKRLIPAAESSEPSCVQLLKNNKLSRRK